MFSKKEKVYKIRDKTVTKMREREGRGRKEGKTKTNTKKGEVLSQQKKVGFLLSVEASILDLMSAISFRSPKHARGERSIR